MSSILAVAAGSWGVVMALSPLLQIRTIVRNRSSADVSLGYLGVLLAGFVLWCSYGLTISNLALVIPNTVSIVATLATIAVVLHYRPRATA